MTRSTSRLIRTKPRAEIITTACSTAISSVIDRLLGQLAEAAAAEDGLGDQRPGNQFAEQQPGNIQRRQQGIPITWRQRTPVSLMPLARATATKG